MTGRIRFLAAILTLLLPWVGTAFAATLVVPSQYDSIGAAFEAAKAGDRIEIQPGTYYETGLVMTEAVDLIGVGTSTGDVIIDGNGNDRILLCQNIEGRPTISKITFARGQATENSNLGAVGGAILFDNSDAMVRDCAFLDNLALTCGGAIRCVFSSPSFLYCYFADNDAPDGGGGAIDASYNSSPTVRNCNFVHNSAGWGGGIACRGAASPTISESTFHSNFAIGVRGYGGGVFADFSSNPKLVGCTFVSNYAHFGGGLASFSGSPTDLTQCTLYGNAAGYSGAGLFCYESAPNIEFTLIADHAGTAVDGMGVSNPILSNSNLYGNSQGNWTGLISDQAEARDNISVDPQFCADFPAQTLDFSLEETSPCSPDINGNGLIGAWSAGCDYTATYLTSFDAAWQGDRVVLNWAVTTTDGNPEFKLTGQEIDDTTVWNIPYAENEPGRFVAEDTSAQPNPDHTYRFQLFLKDGGDWSLLNETELTGPPPAQDLQFLSAYPNPFNPQTTIRFTVGRQEQVRVAVFDIHGKLVRTLADRVFETGVQELTWQGRDSSGRAVGSGTYVAVISGQKQTFAHKLTLLK